MKYGTLKFDGWLQKRERRRDLIFTVWYVETTSSAAWHDTIEGYWHVVLGIHKRISATGTCDTCSRPSAPDPFRSRGNAWIFDVKNVHAVNDISKVKEFYVSCCLVHVAKIVSQQLKISNLLCYIFFVKFVAFSLKKSTNYFNVNK